ncbi:MAG: tetrahydromethanopterin S-methyltransferase subunit A [Dehalococcoidia bacterium]
MRKVGPVDGYPPEEGRYIRGNDYSPVAVCTILDTFDFAIPPELNELVMAGIDTGAAISGMLQTENIGMEKMICNIVANPNIWYIILCGRESAGHLSGESLLALKQNGTDEKMRIIGSAAPTPHLSNIPASLIDRFRKQIVTVVDLLCKPGEKDLNAPGLDPEVIGNAVKSCYQESPSVFREYTLHDIGAYPEPAMVHKISLKLNQPQQNPVSGGSKMVTGLMIHKLLPKTDCQKCGKRNCLSFAIDLGKGKCKLEDCPLLDSPEYAEDRRALVKLLE